MRCCWKSSITFRFIREFVTFHWIFTIWYADLSATCLRCLCSIRRWVELIEWMNCITINFRILDPRRRPHLRVHHQHTSSVQLGCDKLLRMFKVRLGVFRSIGEDSQQVWRSTANSENLVLSAEWSHRVDWGSAGENAQTSAKCCWSDTEEYRV